MQTLNQISTVVPETVKAGTSQSDTPNRTTVGKKMLLLQKKKKKKSEKPKELAKKINNVTS